ncbi:MAG: 8-oxo-dGTP diphosphatase MutT [Bdellovibrionales bacterium]
MSTPRRNNWIPVVTALIQREGKILVGQRPEGQSLAGVWEFPGGKIELGETPEEALKRELQEELGIDAEIGELALASTHSYGATGIILLFYRVHFWKGELRSVHHTNLKWLEPRDLTKWTLPEANRKILPRILNAVGEPDADSLSL